MSDSAQAMPILCTMIYCLARDQVLLMRRNKEPNLGLWVAPGGKVEPGESPYDCAQRELGEETGLKTRGLLFRGLITLTSPRPDWQWILFLYVATGLSGHLDGDRREGEFRWWSLREVHTLPMPQADKVFFATIIDCAQPFYEATYVYNANLDLVEVVKHIPPAPGAGELKNRCPEGNNR
jgi:ADP-ribose pyrophosphatase YjhB (NUDIX family)